MSLINVSEVPGLVFMLAYCHNLLGVFKRTESSIVLVETPVLFLLRQVKRSTEVSPEKKSNHLKEVKSPVQRPIRALTDPFHTRYFDLPKQEKHRCYL